MPNLLKEAQITACRRVDEMPAENSKHLKAEFHG